MILNYTTEVPAEKSIAQIILLLSKKGAQSITQEFFADSRVKSIRFVMKVNDFPVMFSLPVNIDGVAGVLRKERPFNEARNRGGLDKFLRNQRIQAERIGWRILKDWIEAQIAMIESNQAEAGQVFMPYAQRADGQTMFEVWSQNMQTALPATTEEKPQ